MNKKLYAILILIMVIFLFRAVSPGGLKAQETVVFNETITWAWPMNNTYGGNGFYWWHAAIYGKPNLGDMPADNWVSPANYRDGHFYMRIEVLNQPTNTPFLAQMGIWQDLVPGDNYYEENVSLQMAHLDGGAGSVAEVDLGSPSAWYVVWPTLDFTRPEDFNRIGLVLWTDNGSGGNGCIPMAQGWTNSAACVNASTVQESFFPMQLKVTVVACATGTPFSGWDTYTGGGGPRQPTPAYTIDYVNERTVQSVPSTDEYSYNSNMSSAVSGTGSQLSLTPGQDVYFRTKASGELLASYVQHLDVKSNAPAPTFTYDAVNHRTSTTVSSEYEYSSNSNMSGAVSGTGNYVSFGIGETRYFRKKATSTNFKSNIQTLTGSEIGTGGPSNIGPEFVIINDVIEYPYNGTDNGFYFFGYNASMPTNWKQNYDYYNGQVYYRYEIISQATNEPMKLQFGIWQRLPVGSTNDADLYESMAPQLQLNGPGSVATGNSSPNTWWTYHNGVDYTQMDKVWHFGINPWQVNPSVLQIRTENADVWANRGKWFPLTVKVTIVAVASGHTFSGWDNYLIPESAPEFQIDYANERTLTVVESTHEYSTNQSTWTAGSGNYVALTPGTDMYFRKKTAQTLVQHLVVPARPAGPAITIDFPTESTGQVIPSTVQYSTNSNFSTTTDGTGAALLLTPGSTMYFRSKATASAFRSNATTLAVPARPVINCPLTSPTSTSPIPVLITFPGGGTATGLEANDLTVVNGTALAGTAANSFNITPTASGQVIISVKANAINEKNFASTNFTIQYQGPSGLFDNEDVDYSIYPSPAESYIIIETADDGQGTYQIFNSAGTLVDKGLIKEPGQQISVAGLMPGVYEIVIITDENSKALRFIRK